MLGGALVDLEGLCPDAGDVVGDVLLLAGGVDGGDDGVLLAREPALARVVDLGGEAGGGGDEGGALELDEGGAEDEALDVQGGEGDEVGFLLAFLGGGDGQDGVADLLDVDCAGEGGLLGVVALEVDAGWEVCDGVGCCWRVVAVGVFLVKNACLVCGMSTRICILPNLLADELRGAGLVLPFSEEELAEEGVEGLLLVAVLLGAGGVLLLEGGDEPLGDEQGALAGVGLLRGGGEDGGVLAPVGGELCQGGGGEDEGRRGQGGEVAVEGGDGLGGRQEVSFLMRCSFRFEGVIGGRYRDRGEKCVP